MRRRLARLEPLIVLALGPLFWFPSGWWSALALLALPTLWLNRWSVRGNLTVRTGYEWPLLIFLACLPLSLLPVVDWSLATPKLLTILHGISLLYALTNTLTTRSRQLTAGYLIVLLLGGGVALIGLVGTIWPGSKLLPFDPIYNRLPLLIRGVAHAQPEGGIHPNEIGGALTLVVPLALSLILAGSQARSLVGPMRRMALKRLSGILARPLLWIAAFLAVGVLLLTQSRSAYVGTGLAILLIFAWWLLAHRQSSGRPIKRLVLLLVLILANLAVGWRLTATWTSTSDSGWDTLPGRLELWQRSLLMIADFPFTGVGLGQFSAVLHALYPLFQTAPDLYAPHAHNFFLQLGLDFGLLGASSIVWLLAAGFNNLWLALKQTQDATVRALVVGLAASLLGFLVYGLTDAVALSARGGLALWILLALAAAARPEDS